MHGRAEAQVKFGNQNFLLSQKLLHTVSLSWGVEAGWTVLRNDRKATGLGKVSQRLFSHTDKGTDHTEVSLSVKVRFMLIKLKF
jgi:hypothetical protein